jgi:dolichol-phosphate mannosyltransferase
LKRALVTGASGFVGANLVRRLLQAGHETHLLVRPSYETWRLQEIAGAVRMHEANLEDRDGVFRAVAAAKPDWLFHLAAFGAYSHQTGIERMAATNLLGCTALLDAGVKLRMESFVHTGSSSEYGYKDHPAREDELVEPNSDYAITKAAATHYCQNTARKLDINAVTVRLYSIYGPYEDPSRLIPTLLMHGLGGTLPPLVSPQVGRDFVYVDDAVDAILQVAASPTVPRGAVYNICSGVQSTLAEAVDIARKLLSIAAEPVWSSMPQRSWDTSQWVGSPERTAREIGWSAQISLESGLRKTIAWLTEHPEWLSFYSARVFSGSK